MPNAQLARLTLLRDIRRRELDVLDARLDDARSAKAEVDAIWHARIPRPLVPLVATLVSVLAANAAVLTGYCVVIAGCREQFFNALFTITAIATVVALPFGGGGGAGGRARRWLRSLSVVFLAVAFAEVLYAAYELEGAGFRMPT